MDLSWMPTLNAALNASSLVLLMSGRYLIKAGREESHKKVMVTACLVSILFLISYLTYHYLVGHTTFEGQGWIRPVYFTILISHIVLASIVPVLAILLVYWGIQGKRDKHRKLARIAWPVWVYVSITGLLVYFILYHWFPSASA